MQRLEPSQHLPVTAAELELEAENLVIRLAGSKLTTASQDRANPNPKSVAADHTKPVWGERARCLLCFFGGGLT